MRIATRMRILPLRSVQKATIVCFHYIWSTLMEVLKWMFCMITKHLSNLEVSVHLDFNCRLVCFSQIKAEGFLMILRITWTSLIQVFFPCRHCCETNLSLCLAVDHHGLSYCPSISMLCLSIQKNVNWMFTMQGPTYFFDWPPKPVTSQV